jgi:hypothetical protein
MKIIDLMDFLESKVAFTYFPNRFPIGENINIPDFCAAVIIHAGRGIDEWTGKKQPSFQILVRGETRKEGVVEAKAHEIFDSIQNLRNVTVGEDSVVIIRPQGSSPFYIGEDDNNRPVYSMNFNTVIKPKNN